MTTFIPPPFHPAPFLGNAHVQTLAAALLAEPICSKGGTVVHHCVSGEQIGYAATAPGRTLAEAPLQR